MLIYMGFDNGIVIKKWKRTAKAGRDRYVPL
jgi:hypothetical protein